MKKLMIGLFILFYIPSTAYAIVDPLAVPNNKFGIHIIQATPDESSPAAQLANSNGDWGYITVLVESKDRNHEKWQEFFNDLRVRHLIPLVRLATQPDGNYWKKPYEGEEIAWADFLDNLVWPTKNRYVIIYNEPNQGNEWANKVDAKDYAENLDKTINALKKKSEDFFVLNAGFDASAPNQLPNYQDEITFLQQMNQEIPGILNKLDGWVSHCYPNPGFVGSPDGYGRGSVRTWYWELQLLRSLGVTKSLPVFITETGWKHAEGINYDPSLPSTDKVASFFENAFGNAWSSDRIVAVTPFLLSYQDSPFDHFSFKKYTGEKQQQRLVSNSTNILGVQYPEYYPQYQALVDLAKVAGKPVQENKAQLTKGEVYSSIVAGEEYQIALTLKNTGQSIWGDQEVVKLVPTEGGSQLGIEEVQILKGVKIEPGSEYTFQINLHAPKTGSFKVALNLFSGSKQFDSPALEFSIEVKSPVILFIKANLKWKKLSSGEYTLKTGGVIGENQQSISLNYSGSSEPIEARYLLPDYTFEFSLEKPYYHPKTIKQTVHPGINMLDFGTLEPALLGSILNPQQFWQLLPFSN